MINLKTTILSLLLLSLLITPVIVLGVGFNISSIQSAFTDTLNAIKSKLDHISQIAAGMYKYLLASLDLVEPDISSGLIAYWNFDEGSGETAADVSGNVYNASLLPIGTGPLWQADNISGFLLFDGVDDYVELPSDIFNDLESGTIAVWIKKDSDNGEIQTIFNSDNRGYAAYRIQISVDIDNKVLLQGWFGYSYQPNYRLRAKSSTILENGKWYHIAFTSRKGSGNKLYINGAEESLNYLQATSDFDLFYKDLVADPQFKPPFSNFVGTKRISGEFKEFFNGAIDDLRVYNRSLSHEEITEVYELLKPGSSPINHAPEIVPMIGNRVVDENTLLKFGIFGLDPDRDFIAYSAINLPVGAEINGNVFTWIPSYYDAGNHEITFIVTDVKDDPSTQLSASETINIQVNSVNGPPLLEPIELEKRASVDELLEFTVSATDPDNDSVTYEILNKPKNANFNSSTGEFRWIPTAGDKGTYVISIIARDTNNLFDRKAIAIIVNDSLSRVVYTTGELRGGINANVPGATLLIAPGTYEHFSFGNINGAEGAYITIQGLDPDNPPIIQSSNSIGIYSTNSSYLIIKNLRIIGPNDNGIQIGGGGSRMRGEDELSPSHHIILQDLIVEGTTASGNNDGIKVSITDYFTVRNVKIYGYGDGGQGVDCVGCRFGVIEDSEFYGMKEEGYNPNVAINTKGQSEDILIHRNFFYDVSNDQAVNLGGPENTQDGEFGYMGKNIEVAGNRFYRGGTGVSFASVDGGFVHHNTIIFPQKWYMRIHGKYHFRGGEFNNNLVVFNMANIESQRINTGVSAEMLNKYSFHNNAWFEANNQPFDINYSLTSNNCPEEIEGVYGIDPMLTDYDSPTMSIQSSELINHPFLTQGIGADGYLVEPIDELPEINAGEDQTIALPNKVSLNAVMTPYHELIRVKWNKVSGPGTVRFDDKYSLSTEVSFSIEGTYVLRVEQSYGGFASSDTVTITVEPAPYYYSLNLSSGLGGNIVVDPENQFEFYEGYEVRLKAFPDVEYVFDKWSGPDVPIGDESERNLSIIMDSDKSFSASFKTLPYDLDDGLIGHWEFEGDLKDSSPSGIDGVLVGAESPVWISGPVGGALDCEGSAYVDIGDYDIYDIGPNDRFTISVWFKRRDAWWTASDIVSRDNFDIYNSKATPWSLVNIRSGNTIGFSMGNGIEYNLKIEAYKIIHEDWFHIAVVVGAVGENIDFYINGSLQEGKSFIRTINQTLLTGLGEKTLKVCNGNGPCNIDDLRMYNRALNATEIAMIAGELPHEPPENCQDADNDGISDYNPAVCPSGKDVCIKPKQSLTDQEREQYQPTSNTYELIYDKATADIRDIKDFKLRLQNRAEIQFTDNIDLIKLRTADGCFEKINFDQAVTIDQNKAEINTTLYPELNKPAQITFYNITLDNPVIKKDGAICQEPECHIIDYDRTNHILTVQVQGFSKYNIISYKQYLAETITTYTLILATLIAGLVSGFYTVFSKQT